MKHYPTIIFSIVKTQHVTVAASVIFVFLFLVLSTGCKKEDPAETIVNGPSATGHLYVMSNDASQNSIIHFTQNSDGTLTQKETTLSGGAGTSAALGSQGAIQIDPDNEWLFAVNSGDHTISSFAIASDGSLSLAHTVSSNGTHPVSLTTYGNLVYVVNSSSYNLTGFLVLDDGMLIEKPGTDEPLSASNATPAQISFRPDGNYIIVTEKVTNKIGMYPVGKSGVTGDGVFIPSSTATPSGFECFVDDFIIVTQADGNAPGAGTVASYSATDCSPVGEAVGAGQTASGWTVMNDEHIVFVTNTLSNTISSFNISGTGDLQLLQNIAANTATAPADVALSVNEKFLYTINSGSDSITAFRVNSDGTLTSIGEYDGIPANAVGIATF